MSSFTVFVSSTISQCSDGEELKLHGEKKSQGQGGDFFFFFFPIANSLYNEGQPSSQLSYAFVFWSRVYSLA